jgi:ubiquinone/menaquinone biosynthesis C-methylase UbiE/uncharacterized protein YbaR (Trm112 family)
MKPSLLSLLVCPIDHQSLELVVFLEEPVTLTPVQVDKIQERGQEVEDYKKEILQGVLLNPRKKILYPIYQGVPRLLLFTHPLIKIFCAEFDSLLVDFFAKGYQFSTDASVPGERNVLASFSNEWTDYGYNEEVYWGQSTKVYNESLYATLHHEKQSLTNKIILEVGIGSGGSANYMTSRFDCTLVGVDLGYSVDVAYQTFNKNPFFHIVQASVFNLPFQDNSFDFVYSHGVIHHTFNTRKAFDQLCRFPKSEGRLYMWVYSFLNEQRTLKRRIIMIMERLIRPWCSLLPGWMQTIVLIPLAPLYIFHQNTFHTSARHGMAKYNWREAMHAARDRFTPKYIHRHSEEEVMTWFSQNSFRDIRPLSARSLPDYVPVGFYKNTGVEGFKQ